MISNEEISRVYVQKKNGKYVETYRDNNPTEIWSRLAHNLIAKKINRCTYIRCITRTQLYTGYIRIKVMYQNGDRDIYTVPE